MRSADRNGAPTGGSDEPDHDGQAIREATFETLNKPDFAAARKQASPMVHWDKPFNAFQAARAKE